MATSKQNKELTSHTLTVRIRCPGCLAGLRLEEFAITHHFDQTWSAEPSIICDDCGAHFKVSHSCIFPIYQRDLKTLFPHSRLNVQAVGA